MSDVLSSYHIIYNDEEMELLKYQNDKWCTSTLHKDTHPHTPTNICQAKKLYNLSQKKDVLANGLQFPGKK